MARKVYKGERSPNFGYIRDIQHTSVQWSNEDVLMSVCVCMFVCVCVLVHARLIIWTLIYGLTIEIGIGNRVLSISFVWEAI